MAKDKKEDLLQEELEIEDKRILKDEKIVFVSIIVAGLLFGIIIGVLIFIYLEIKNENNETQNIHVPEEASKTIEIEKEKDLPAPPVPTVLINQNSATSTEIKDHFLSFGSGSSNSQVWADVGGLQASVDLNSYGNIKEIKFEASVQDPGENQAVSVRVFNKTDNHPVWNSEVIKNAGADSFLVSSPIIYDSGTKTYVIQMKTQLGSSATLGESRLHIIIK